MIKDDGFLLYIWGVGEVEGRFVEIAMLGDREIIGSTPKNPVIMRTGG